MTDKGAGFVIDFAPAGRRGRCPGDKTLLDCARDLGAGINSVCGGIGNCQSCRVRILSGTVSPPTSNELAVFSPGDIQNGWRLACQVYPASDCRVSIPPESMISSQRTQVEVSKTAIPLEPVVRAYDIQLSPPSALEPGADADRLIRALGQKAGAHCDRTDIELLRSLSPLLRSWDWHCEALVRNGELIAIQPSGSCQFGLAIDLGSTKVAGYLVDLNSGETLAAKGMVNPQVSYGGDIISRVTHALNSAEGGIRLQELAIEALNELATELSRQANARPEEIVEVVAVGNTVMHHLLLRLPLRQLALSPFVPAISRAMDIKARELGLNIAPGAYIHLPPNIAGFIGSDHVAMLLAAEVTKAKGTVIALDIGTNTEISLARDGRVSAVSCASGPAFEGGHIKGGMRAIPGAIERVWITEDGVRYQTIEGAPPLGICGSGILDAVAQLYLLGVIDPGGRMKGNHPRVRTHEGQTVFTLVSQEEREGLPAIVITQSDVREIQLAKAAIRTGIQVLLDENGCSEEEIEQVTIAGAFGSYVDINSAITVGMLPWLPVDRFQQVGNAAGAGAKLSLISLSKRIEAQEIASRVKYIELASCSGFTETLIQSSYLGKYRLRQGKRTEIA